MLFDPGPLPLLPDSVFPRLDVRRDFEAAAAGEVSALEQHAFGLGIQASVIASALGSSTQGLEGLELAAFAQELAHQPSDLDTTVGGVAASVDVLEREFGGLIGELPDPNVVVPEPTSGPPAGTETPGAPPPGPGPITPDPGVFVPFGSRPTPTPAPPPSGDLYDGSDAARALQRYAEVNPNERSRIEAFLRANYHDFARAPGALGLPGWVEFYGRWQRGEA
jgi:hypothetical protein